MATPGAVIGGADAHIVATGAQCAVGLTAASAAAALRAGISRIAEHPYLIDSVGEKVFCASVPTIDPAMPVADRMVALAAGSLVEIADKLISARAWPADVPVFLAVPESRPGFGARQVTQVAESLASFPVPATRSINVTIAGEGHAGALAALQTALAQVSLGRHPVAVVGGVDSYLEASTIAWLDAHRRLNRNDIRSGFPPGEAAALFAVTARPTCDRFGLASLARIRGVACAREHRDPASDTGLLGEALRDAVLGAAGQLTLPDELITDTYGDINGELARSHDWGFALIRTSAYFRDGTDYIMTAGQCGDVGAATAALGCILATEAWQFDCAHGNRALVWAASWGGLRAAAVLQRDAV